MTSKREALKAIKRERYKDRVKELRKYFEGFEASKGFNLRDIDKWTPQAKRKITNYWEVMGIQVARPHVVKYYRRPDHIKAAAEFAQQDKQLKGQKAVLIPVDDPKNLSVKFTKSGEIKVKRGGVSVSKIFFNKKRFLDDPIAELERALAKTDAQLFKLIQGPHESSSAVSREDLAGKILKIIERYGDDRAYDPDDRRSSFVANWLNGIIPYSVKDAGKVLKDSARYEKLMRESQVSRKLKKSQQQYKISRRARLTGRR